MRQARTACGRQGTEDLCDNEAPAGVVNRHFEAKLPSCAHFPWASTARLAAEPICSRQKKQKLRTHEQACLPAFLPSQASKASHGWPGENVPRGARNLAGMCAPSQEEHDGAQQRQQLGSNRPQVVCRAGTTSAAQRRLITNVRWFIGFLSTVNFMVGLWRSGEVPCLELGAPQLCAAVRCVLHCGYIVTDR